MPDFTPPNNHGAEWSVVAHMLARPDVVPEIIGTQIESDDFFGRDTRVIFDKVTESYYSDEAVDPLIVGEVLKRTLADIWSVPEGEVPVRLASRVQGHALSDAATDHATLVKGLGDKRRLQVLALSAVHAIQDGSLTSEEIGDMLATEAAKITVGSAKRGEVLSWMAVGSDFAKYMRRVMRARELGIEIGAYFGMPFVDDYTKGLLPTELMMLAGPPGVGKSAVGWEMARGFAKRQALHPPERRVATLILSLEMGTAQSGQRLATSLTGIDGGRLREGKITEDELREIVKEWRRIEDLPLYFNFASNFRLTQLRALVVEAIRRHNVGLVVIDHFRQIDPDRRVNNPNQEDEHKARFLKESIAKDLNVCVICLAHTIKLSRENSDGRPKLSDLRGSGQVAAHCDVVSFVYRPSMHMTQEEMFDSGIMSTDAEMLYEKNRNGSLGSAPFHFDAAKMVVRSK